MALIKCPECNKEISDMASACPCCGYPISNTKKPIIGKMTLACPNCGYYVGEIVKNILKKIEKIQKAKEEYQKVYRMNQKLYIIMKAVDIPCTEFPSDSSDSLEWFSNNFNEIKKITLNHIELISANAKEDYEELQERIKKEEESIEEERKEREEEEKMKEFYAQCDKTNAEAEALAQRLRAAARGERIAPTQKCPNCGSSNVSSISTAKRLASTTLWGLASSTLGKTKECKSCGYKW